MEPPALRPEGEVDPLPGLPSAPGLSLAELRYPPGLRLPRHSHDGGVLCVAVRGGFGEDVRRTRFEAEQGALTWLPPGEPHRNQVGSAGLLGLRVEVGPGWLGAKRAAAEHPPRIARGGAVAGFATALVREVRRGEDALAAAIESLVVLVLAELVRSEAPARGAPPAWLCRVRERLRDEPGVSPSLGDLAREAGVHPGHLARAFRRYFGCTAGDYLREHRLERARDLLRRGDEPLAAVALRCGFADQSHLGRAFKRRYGVSPGAFRRS